VPISSISNEVAPGIVYTEIVYDDKDGAPVRAYAISIKKGAATIQTTMPSDSADKKGTVAKMSNQLSAAISNGKNVLAGVNADFFDMGGTNVMRGLCIKDGVFISGTGERPWFGITNDGNAVMGTSAEYANYKDKLFTAVGGSHIILKNGGTDNLSIGTEFSDTRHPRTAAGVTSDGTVVLIVVDGRQPEISNGASLADLAYIMSTLDCVNAINLDGGGSSTFILKNEKGELVTENSPSAGSLRAVANGLMVVLP
jgi:exopolysaccharide biosynthesis protein